MNELKHIFEKQVIAYSKWNNSKETLIISIIPADIFENNLEAKFYIETGINLEYPKNTWSLSTKKEIDMMIDLCTISYVSISHLEDIKQFSNVGELLDLAKKIKKAKDETSFITKHFTFAKYNTLKQSVSIRVYLPKEIEKKSFGEIFKYVNDHNDDIVAAAKAELDTRYGEFAKMYKLTTVVHSNHYKRIDAKFHLTTESI